VQTQETIVNSILAAAPKLGDESVLKLICEQFGLDWEEVQALLEDQESTPAPLIANTDPSEPDIDGNEIEQGAEPRGQWFG
jgi:predicted DsbA family dithiol-disulfide isomerase